MDRKKAFFILVTAFYWVSTYTYMPIFAVYLDAIHVPSRTIGLILGSYGIVQMLLRLPVGIVSARLQKSKVFIHFGLVFSVISAVGLAYTADPVWILLFRGLAGAVAATWVDYTVLYASYFKPEQAARAVGEMNFMCSFSQMGGMLVGGVLAQYCGYRSTFLAGAAAAFFALALSFFLREKKEPVRSSLSIGDALSVVRDKNLLLVSFLAVLSQMVTFATVFGFTPIYAKTLGANDIGMTILVVAANLPAALAALIQGGRGLSRRGLIICGFIVNGIFTLMTPFIQNFIFLVLCQALAGFGRGLSYSLLMGLSILHIPTEKRSVAMGFFQAVYGLGMFLGPALMGLVGERNLQSGFVIAGAVALLSAAPAWFVGRGARKAS